MLMGKQPELKYKAIAVITCFTLLLGSLFAAAAGPGESYVNVYKGTPGAASIIKNLAYTDINGLKTWTKEAIHESGALGIIKGYGSKQYKPAGTFTKEEAIAIAYRAAGREADAQKAAEALDAAKSDSNKKTNAVDMWADGYLKLASDEGLITQKEYRDTLSSDQANLAAGSFKRTAPATRQEFAYWLAKTLKLEPVYGQYKIFNGYNDWKQADPIKIPYIEALLEKNIMSSTGSGYFKPLQSITREQAALVIKNAEAEIIKLLNYTKQTGTVEAIYPLEDYSSGNKGLVKEISIRDSEGKLDAISSSTYDTDYVNEQEGSQVTTGSLELVVDKNGVIGGSNLLKAGDRVQYLADKDGQVRYASVLSNKSETRYIAARLDNIDTTNRKMKVTQFMTLDYPDPSLVNTNASLNPGAQQLQASYIYSSNLPVLINGRKTEISSLSPDSTIILAVNGSNLVTAVYMADFSLDSEESNVVSGIVEDVNPDLGYITLYSSSVVYPGKTGAAPVLKTYNYVNPKDIDIYKNHKPSVLEDIEPGDTAFLKLDNDKSVISISAADNYSLKYARVISQMPSGLALEFDDGTQQVLPVTEEIPVVSEGSLTNFTDIRDGDRVRLLVNESTEGTVIKEITIQGSEHLITGIYKGTISSVDQFSRKISAAGLETLVNGKWIKSSRKGVSFIKLSDGCSFYFGNKKLDTEKLGTSVRNTTAYIAVEKDYGGNEQVVLLSFRDGKDTEVTLSDSVSNALSGSGKFDVSSMTGAVAYDSGSIIVKNGRLVTGNSIDENDSVCVVANRDYGSGEYKAGVVNITEKTGAGFLEIYRGRVSNINDGQDFTIESFSRLSGLSWEYYNTPKTFKLDNQTRILDDNGVVGQRDFTSFGADSYKNRVVYIVAKDNQALLVTTAPYGTANIRGEVYSLSGGMTGEEGTLLEEPDELNLKAVTYYDQSQRLWVSGPEMTLDLGTNGIILKNGLVIKPSELLAGDRVRVIKRDTSSSGEAYIIIVES